MLSLDYYNFGGCFACWCKKVNGFIAFSGDRIRSSCRNFGGFVLFVEVFHAGLSCFVVYVGFVYL